jgi:serine/threonine-protein kinase
MPTGYGAVGPGGTTGYGPPSGPVPTYAPVPPGGGKPNRLPLIIAAAVLVVGLVVVGIVLLTGDDGGGGGGGGGGTATDTSQPTTPSTTPPTTAPPPPDPEEELLAIIPAGFDRENCRTQDAAGDGDLAALDCGSAVDQPGPSDSAFYLYEDGDTVDGVFLDDTERLGLSELPAGTNCPAAQGYQDWTNADQSRGGRIACYVRDDNASVLLWTHEEFGAEAIVFLADGGVEGLQTLIDWWRVPSNSDFAEE